VRIRYNPSNPRDFYMVGQRDIRQAGSALEMGLSILFYASVGLALGLLSLPIFGRSMA
jgi:hypothetical protein